MPAPEAVASGIMASQKSSPVAVTVISYITTDSSLQGLMAIPCLVGQIFQVHMYFSAGCLTNAGPRCGTEMLNAPLDAWLGISLRRGCA